MAVSPLVEIVMVAAQIKAAAPELFAKLCAALANYEVQAVAEILASDTSHDLFRVQGKIKTVQQLRKNLTECTELRDSYTKRGSNG